jgi:hypothetical protein
MAEDPPEDDEDEDGAETATSHPFCAVTGGNAPQQFAHLCSMDGFSAAFNRMSRTEGSNATG